MINFPFGTNEKLIIFGVPIHSNTSNIQTYFYHKKILSIWTDRSGKTVQTKITLPTEEKSCLIRFFNVCHFKCTFLHTKLFHVFFSFFYVLKFITVNTLLILINAPVSFFQMLNSPKVYWFTFILSITNTKGSNFNAFLSLSLEDHFFSFKS